MNFPTGSPKQKQRHGCLTAFLIFMLLANLLAAYGNIAMQEGILSVFPRLSSNLILILAAGGLLNVVFVIAIFNWKKWGFWGFSVSAIIVFSINVYGGVGVFAAVAGLAGVLVLFAVLKIGKEKAGWDQLE